MPTTTPLMSLVLPDVSLTAGPLWASYLNAAFTLVDSHDHSSGKGSRVTPSGLNINAELAFGGNNASGLRVVRFNAQGATLSGGTEVRELYFVGTELYANDGNGNAIKITNAGALNVAGVAGIGGDYGGANPAALNFVDATSTYEFYENPGTVSFGNLKFLGLDSRGSWRIASTVLSGSTVLTDTDNNVVLLVDTNAARTLTFPDPTLGKRLFIVHDKTGLSETNAITMARFAVGNKIDGTAADKTLKKNFGTWIFLSDGVDTWWLLKEDLRDVTSFTSFVGPTSGSDTLTLGAWTAFPLSGLASTFTEGLAVSRSTNDLTFPAVGKYEFEIFIQNWAISGNTQTWGLRVRNTTDSTTADVDPFTNYATTPGSAYITKMQVNVTDASKTYQLQYWANAGGGSPSSSFGAPGAGNGGESAGVRWNVKIRKLKNT